MRILVVEDDLRLARVLSRGLRENAYAVDVASTGSQALYHIGINTYDGIILDVMIPAPDGLFVCREIRTSRVTVPILLLTARDTIDDKIVGLDAGADDYMTKPFDFGELLARLRALLRRKTEIIPSMIRIADLELDTRSQHVWRSGERIELTTKEYALLEYLAREKGRVVGRAEIAEHVWNESFDAFSNLIDVYIKRLRRKIDEGRGLELIRTRRGAGYILDDAI
jgi:DNA-binding response OmpR family regulator